MKDKRWLHILQMVLTAPGRELYLEAGRLRKKPETVRVILLVLLLPLLFILLWCIRGNFYVLLFGGGAMAVGFFYIYFMILKKSGAILDFIRKLGEPAYKVFEKHRTAMGWGVPGAESKTEKATGSAGKRGGTAASAEPAGAESAADDRDDEYMRRFKEAAGRAREEKRRERERREKAWRERKARESRERQDKKREDKQKSRAETARDEAETIFMVKHPYSEAEIKSKRNMLLKKYHPDNAEGSEEMCKKINECYALLLKYCV